MPPLSTKRSITNTGYSVNREFLKKHDIFLVFSCKQQSLKDILYHPIIKTAYNYFYKQKHTMYLNIVNKICLAFMINKNIRCI